MPHVYWNSVEASCQKGLQENLLVRPPPEPPAQSHPPAHTEVDAPPYWVWCYWCYWIGCTTCDWPASDDDPSPSPLIILILPCLLLTEGRLDCFSAHALLVMVSLSTVNLSGLSDISTQHETMQIINDFHRDIVSFLTNQQQQLTLYPNYQIVSFQSLNYHIALKLTIININNSLFN